jgi:hypothetical protein
MVHPKTGREGLEGDSWIALLFLLPRFWMGWMVNAALSHGKRPGTHCTGGLVGHRTGLNGYGKIPPPQPGFDPRTFHFVASRYTEYVVPAH